MVVASTIVRQWFAVGRFAVAIGVVFVVTALYTIVLQVNPTTVALSYLIAILLVSTTWGLAEAMTASVVAVLCFNFFFLPPVGTLTIADPQNWVAFVAFLVTAVVASQLSGRARRRELDAGARQRDLERLYALSRTLLLSDRGGATPGEIARHVADAFELQMVGIYDQRTDAVAWGGLTWRDDLNDRLREVARRGVSVKEPNVEIVAIQLGGAPIGSVALVGGGLSDTVLQSMANLVAIGLERARAADATARAEAARQSSELRATVLDALAHEFKTPLTAMKAASSDLLDSEPAASRSHELASIIDEELDRLSALVTDAVQMLRIDAGDFVVRLGHHAVAPLVDAAIRRYAHHLDGHQVSQQVPAGLSVEADRDLLSLALRQLLDNAIKYSPPTSIIEVAAGGDGVIDISIRNSGPAIPEREQARIFERFYRGAQARHVPGTGMGLAIVQQIMRAHNGHLAVTSTQERGTVFTLSLPHGGSTS
ncbi:MAG TPA: ATP-binding protein [Vicinamibacterales bacterium]|nr:ATP-binding protein [Vicinamibacterales bacterium]